MMLRYFSNVNDASLTKRDTHDGSFFSEFWSLKIKRETTLKAHEYTTSLINFNDFRTMISIESRTLYDSVIIRLITFQKHSIADSIEDHLLKRSRDR